MNSRRSVSLISAYSNRTVGWCWLPLAWYLASICRASSARSFEISQRGDSGIHQMKMIWMSDGAPWMIVGILHDHSDEMCLVPNDSHVLTMAPRFHRQL